MIFMSLLCNLMLYIFKYFFCTGVSSFVLFPIYHNPIQHTPFSLIVFQYRRQGKTLPIVIEGVEPPAGIIIT